MFTCSMRVLIMYMIYAYMFNVDDDDDDDVYENEGLFDADGGHCI